MSTLAQRNALACAFRTWLGVLLPGEFRPGERMRARQSTFHRSHISMRKRQLLRIDSRRFERFRSFPLARLFFARRPVRRNHAQGSELFPATRPGDHAFDARGASRSPRRLHGFSSRHRADHAAPDALCLCLRSAAVFPIPAIRSPALCRQSARELDVRRTCQRHRARH